MQAEFIKLVSGREMAEIDRRTIEERGIPGVELMERAGRGVVDAVVEKWEGLEDLQAVIVCGKGNNGGDGFVAGRLLRENGVAVRLFLAVETSAVVGDAAHHMHLFEEGGGQVEPLLEAEGFEQLRRALEEANLALDALLGTGVRGAPRESVASAIECLGQSGVPVVSVDLPSGLDADTGAAPGACVDAVLTVTFGLPKVGHMFFPGRDRCGILHLVDIGFPDDIVSSSPATAGLLTGERVSRLIPQRPGDAHKGSCGSVAVVAGSVGMTGAAALTADAALRAGAGRVSLGAPASLNDILEVKLTEVMTRPLPEVRKHRCLALRALGEIVQFLERADCLALGPGLGRHGETAELVRRLVERVELPLVLDADGLNALAAATDILKKRTAPTVLTPHLGEFARLSGRSKDEIVTRPIEVARHFAEAHQLVLVLKGAPSVVALPDGQVLVNSTGNAGMATAGSGDVLTGLIAGLLAQGLEADEAACLGVYLHGRAGDLAGDNLGEWGMVAGDIARAVPEALLDTYRHT